MEGVDRASEDAAVQNRGGGRELGIGNDARIRGLDWVAEERGRVEGR